MKITLIFALLFTVVALSSGKFVELMNDEALAQQYMNEFSESIELAQKLGYDTVIREIKDGDLSSEEGVSFFVSEGYFFSTVFTPEAFMKVEELKRMPYRTFENQELRRHVERLIELYGAGLTVAENERFISVMGDLVGEPSQMVVYYNATTKSKCNYEQAISNADEIYQLQYLWTHSRKLLSTNFKAKYAEFVRLFRKRAEDFGYPSPSEMWYRDIEHVKGDLTEAMQQLVPYYNEFHATIRSFLQYTYGKDLIPDNQPIPEVYFDKAFYNIPQLLAHIVERPVLELTSALYSKDPVTYMRDADDFFFSMNMGRLPATFWQKSTRNTSKFCSPFIYYSGIGDDIAMTYCSDMNLMTVYDKFTEIHHYIKSANQPLFDRGPHQSGLHRASSLAVVLSALSWNNVKKYTNITDDSLKDSYRAFKNFMLAAEFMKTFPQMFIEEVFVADSIHNGSPFSDNCHYWTLKQRYTGIIPVGKRTSDDYDMYIGTSVPVPLDELPMEVVQYITAFQIYEALCKLPGAHFDKDLDGVDLFDTCDFSTSPEAGEILSSMMALGGSRPWMEVLTEYLGIEKISTDSLIKYFAPLYEVLKNINGNAKATVGWENVDVCTSATANIV